MLFWALQRPKNSVEINNTIVFFILKMVRFLRLEFQISLKIVRIFRLFEKNGFFSIVGVRIFQTVTE